VPHIWHALFVPDVGNHEPPQRDGPFSKQEAVGIEVGRRRRSNSLWLWQKQDGYSQAAVLNGLFHQEKGHFMKFIEATPFLFLP
jgi:hypothetical protein